MEYFTIVEVNGSNYVEFDVSSIFWKTCLRRLYFFENIADIKMNEKKELSIFSGKDAYLHLLEIICGLRSEISGETQVLGQFKNFLAETEIRHHNFYKKFSSLFQNLLQDCKEIREKHIQNWGGSSYGSISRRLSDQSSNVILIGNGTFSDSILPWLKGDVIIMARNPKKPTHLKLTRENFIKLANNNTSLVVAAPLQNSELTELLLQTPIKALIDWRADSSLSYCSATNYYSFDSLKKMMTCENLRRKELIAIAKSEVENKAEIWDLRKLFRPQGWEDLCV